MSGRPSVCVVTPAYNSARFLDAAVESVAAQNYPALEHILVDDGSTDDLAERARAYAGRIRYLRQEHRGPSAARNLAIRESHSDLIAFLDIDDLWSPDHLQRLAGALDAHPEAGIAQGLIRNFITAGDGARYFCSRPYRFYLVGSSVFRRPVVEQCGSFDETLRFAEDYDFALRCWESDVPKINMDAVTMYYYRHEANMTAVKKSPVEMGLLQVFRRRNERIRAGVLNPDLPRRVPANVFLGASPRQWDDGSREPIPLPAEARP